MAPGTRSAVTLTILLSALAACSYPQRAAPSVQARPSASCTLTASNPLPQPDGTTILFARCAIVGAAADDDAVRQAATDVFQRLRADAEAKGYREVVVSAQRGDDRGSLNVVFRRAGDGDWVPAKR